MDKSDQMQKEKIYMNVRKNFDGYADDYTIGRPQYSEGLVDQLLADFDPASNVKIADIGSGTGKFSSQLLARGFEVYSVEPNDDMRRVAEEELSGFNRFHSVNGGAEDTSLDSASVDLVTTAQAFHWFDVDKFRAECKRILRSNAKVALVWNVRDMKAPVNQELYDIYKRYCPRFVGFSGGIVKNDPRIQFFFESGYKYISYPNPLTLDKEKFIARSLSGSYSIKEDDSSYEEYMDSITDIFSKYSVSGSVIIPNDSVAYIGCL